MTMAQLASRAELTPGAISQIESGTIHPSLTSLRRIAAALDEPIFKFFLDHAADQKVVVRKDERRRVEINGGSTTYELLTPTLRGDLEVMEMRISPGGASAEEPMGHPGEECLLVISGRLRFELGEDTFDLGPGDSATYRGEIPHRSVNIGDGELVIISSVTPPSF